MFSAPLGNGIKTFRCGVVLLLSLLPPRIIFIIALTQVAGDNDGAASSRATKEQMVSLALIALSFLALPSMMTTIAIG